MSDAQVMNKGWRTDNMSSAVIPLSRLHCDSTQQMSFEGLIRGRCAGDEQGLEDRQHVIEGLARVTAHLPAKAAAQAGQHLIAPFLQQAQACLDSESGVCCHQHNPFPSTSPSLP